MGHEYFWLLLAKYIMRIRSKESKAERFEKLKFWSNKETGIKLRPEEAWLLKRLKPLKTTKFLGQKERPDPSYAQECKCEAFYLTQKLLDLLLEKGHLGNLFP